MICLKSVLRGRTGIIQVLLALGITLLWNPQFAWSQRQQRQQKQQKQEPVKCDLPPVDIPGEDLPDFPRFPGSIRVQYTRNTERFNFVESTRIKGVMCQFLSASDMKSLMDFYSKNLLDKGWKIISSQYMSSNKAVLSLEKEPNRMMLTLEPKMESVSSRVGGKEKKQLIPSKCYQTSVFYYRIPPEIQQEPGAFP